MILKIEIIDNVFALNSRDEDSSCAIQEVVDLVWSKSLADFFQTYTSCYEHFSYLEFNPLWDEKKIGPYDSNNRFHSFIFILTMIETLSASQEIEVEIAPTISCSEKNLILQASLGAKSIGSFKNKIFNSIHFLRNQIRFILGSINPKKMLARLRDLIEIAKIFVQITKYRHNLNIDVKKRGGCVIYLPDGYEKEEYLSWRDCREPRIFCKRRKTISFFANGDDSFFRYLKFSDLYRCLRGCFLVLRARLRLDIGHRGRPTKKYFVSNLSYWYFIPILKFYAAKRYFELHSSENDGNRCGRVRQKFITFEGIYNKQTAYLNMLADKNGYLTVHVNSRQLTEFRPSSHIPRCFIDTHFECLPREIVGLDPYSMNFMKRQTPFIKMKLSNFQNSEKVIFSKLSNFSPINHSSVVVIALQRKQDGRAELFSIAEKCLALGCGVVLKEHPGFPLETIEMIELKILDEMAANKGLHFSVFKEGSLDCRLQYIACVSVYSSFPLEKFTEENGIIWAPFLSLSSIVMKPIMSKCGKVANNQSELINLLKEKLGVGA